MGGGAPVLTKRSFALAGHRTSVALEDEFWLALSGIAAREGATLSALVAQVDGARAPARSLASALRLLALHHASGQRKCDEGRPDREIPAVD